MIGGLTLFLIEYFFVFIIKFITSLINKGVTTK